MMLTKYTHTHTVKESSFSVMLAKHTHSHTPEPADAAEAGGGRSVIRYLGRMWLGLDSRL